MEKTTIKEDYIEKKHIAEYIEDMLHDSNIGNREVKNAEYHHNTSYKDTSSTIRNGILSLEELNKRGIRKMSQSSLELMDDDSSHINGTNGISLAVMGLTDLYRDELEYNPYNPSQVDILISNEVVARRKVGHYGNEFIAENCIEPDKLKSIDVRLLQYIRKSNLYESKTSNSGILHEAIEKYNYLREIALAIKEQRLDVMLREMSSGHSLLMDIDKISCMSKLKLK